MFSKKTNSAPAQPRQARTGTFSVIGADVVISGDLITTENLQVNGRIDGNVRCAGLMQGPGGVIAGNIDADEARIAGLVDGAVTTRVLTLDPDRHHEVLRLALDLARRGLVESAEGYVEVLADAAILGGDWERAVEALGRFVAR